MTPEHQYEQEAAAGEAQPTDGVVHIGEALPDERDGLGHRVVGQTQVLAQTDEAGNIEVVHIADLNIDRSYQRDLDQSLVQAMAAAWDMAAAGPIVVSRRPNGSLWIVNGQHRAAAAQLAGETEILAQVIEELGPKEEAILRLRGNFRRTDKPQERFRAQVAAGLDESIKIAEIAESFGAKINFSPDSKHGINCVSTLEEIYRRAPQGMLLIRTLEFVKDAYGSIDGPTAASQLLKGIAFLLNRNAGEMDRQRMMEKLSVFGPAALLRRAADHRAIHGGSMWVNYYRAMIEVYNDRLPDRSPNRLEARTTGWTREGYTGAGNVGQSSRTPYGGPAIAQV